MVSAKVCLILAVCVVVLMATAEAKAQKKARADVDPPYEHLQKMRKRMSLLAHVAKHMARDGAGEEDDPDAGEEPPLDKCFGGYKAEKCGDDEEEEGA